MAERPTHARSGPLDENSSIVVVIKHASLVDLITRSHLLRYWNDLERRQDRGV